MKEGARAPGRAIRHLVQRNPPRRHLGGHLVEVVEHAVLYASRSKTPGVVLFCSCFFHVKKMHSCACDSISRAGKREKEKDTPSRDSALDATRRDAMYGVMLPAFEI